MNRKKSKGFTLLEMLIALALGTLVMGAGVIAYKQAQDSTTYMTQRTSVQGNARTAVNQLSQDLNNAGYGLPLGGIVVPATATFSCSTGSSSAGFAYACPSTSPAFPKVSSDLTMTAVMPGAALGTFINGKATDQVSVSFVDSQPSIGCTATNVVCGFDAYPLTQSDVAGNTVTLTFDSRTTPAIDDARWGFKKGDLAMVSNSSGQAIGEVTDVTGTTLVLGGSDPMKINGTASGTVGHLLPVGTATYWSGSGAQPKKPLTATTVSRIYIVTYFVQTDPLTQASGTSALPTRLYRMVNGDSSTNPPTPVAEQISNLTFSYNLFNSVCGGTQLSNQKALTSDQFGLIKTINVRITAASTLGTNAIPGQKIQQVPLSTSVSPRNLSYFDSYSSAASGSC